MQTKRVDSFGLGCRVRIVASQLPAYQYLAGRVGTLEDVGTDSIAESGILLWVEVEGERVALEPSEITIPETTEIDVSNPDAL